ncbi:MAG TPA: PilN domain-containing protein [Thermoanaerobaculia bacterium]|nr:PilN domain-containing protein [Thermoanaerobaculia bacterium]
MIRINLLAEGKRAVARRPRGGELRLPIGNMEPAVAALLALLVLSFVLLGGYYLFKRHQLSQRKAEVAIAQKEADELAPIIKEVESYKKKKAELEHKIKIINDLKANQKGPVKIMDAVSRALPELLWLNRMQVHATSIVISGEAFNTNAVANFIENLDKVPEFAEPILRDTTQQGRVYTFTLSFNYSFTNPPAGADTTDKTAPASSGG